MKHNDWWPWLQEEWKKPYFVSLAAFVHQAYAEEIVFPPKADVFAAFENCAYADIKVVILGQDPYHEPHQAHGMCFSVLPGTKIPPSLLNIYKELQAEFNLTIPDNGYLMPWAKQGVFLLNTVMTVRQGAANSHAGKGWETFTDHVIAHINEKEDPVVFLLWGRNARNKAKMIDHRRHLVLEAAHPSPLSAANGFFGCGHFQKANAFLESHGRQAICWQIPNERKEG